MISKEHLIKGNVFIVNDKTIKSGWYGDENDTILCDSDNDKKLYPNFIVPKDKYKDKNGETKIPFGKKITFIGKDGYRIYFKVEDCDMIYYSYNWALLKYKLNLTDESIIPDLSNELRYKIFYQGEQLKPKYFNDLGKIKSSLLIEFGYYQNQYDMFEKYKNINPEIENNEIPYWFEGDQTLNREKCENIEIRSFIKGTKDKVGTKIDFDVVKYFDTSMKLIDVTAKFGNAAREMFKKSLETKDYEYILVYIPDEYRDPTNFQSKVYSSNFDFSKLKENDRIKTLIKNSKLKVKKCTKFGKTAILLKNMDELKTFIFKMNNDEFIVLDCNGDELEKVNNRYVKLQSIMN